MPADQRPASKVSFFPQPYDGELVYSMIARYGAQLGHPSAAGAYTDLTGDRLQRPVVDLPFRLDALASRLPSRFGLTGAKLLARHTLFPFYAAYSPTRVVKAAERAAFGEAGKVGLLLGSRAKPVPLLDCLRFCPECQLAMERRNEDLHWLRIHQVPIATFCAVHRTPLRSSTVEVGGIDGYLHAASRVNCPEDASSLVSDSVDHATLLQLSLDAANLLDGNHPVRAPKAVAKRLSQKFADKGYSFNGSQLDWAVIERESADLVAGLALVFPGIRNFAHAERGWLRDALDASRATGSDAILLTTLLATRAADLSKPFGNGPWKCVNPLADHRGRAVVREVRLQLFGSGMARGWFTCSCGYCYTRTRSPDGSLGQIFFVSFGPLLQPYVLEKSAAGESITAAGRGIGLAAKTLVRAIRTGQLMHAWDAASFDRMYRRHERAHDSEDPAAQ